jgi:hypothetical protein
MTLITTKAGVTFGGFSPALVRILSVLIALSERYCVVITSGSDGQHLPTSRHYTFEAVDLKVKHFTEAQKQAFINALREGLGARFTVLHESAGLPQEHLHVQPVKGSTFTLDHLRAV